MLLYIKIAEDLNSDSIVIRARQCREQSLDSREPELGVRTLVEAEDLDPLVLIRLLPRLHHL